MSINHRRNRWQEGHLIFGVGVNDSDYVVYPTIDGKRVACPFYFTWKSMLQRCYDPKFQKKYPTYKGCVELKIGIPFLILKDGWRNKNGKAIN